MTGLNEVDEVVWRKIDCWLLPLCTIFYLLATIDRSNIGNARVAGLQKALAMSNYQYSMALTVTYVAFIAAEFPFTWLLKHVGPDLMLPTTITLFGLASASQGLVHDYSGLLACRFFLGFLEGGLNPCLVLYLSCFYPRRRLQIRIATYAALGTLAGAFSGLLAAAIDHMDGLGSKPGWAWIFILEGILAVVFGVISFFILPRSPEKARFLTGKEREYVISILKHTGTVSDDDAKDRFSWPEVAKCAKSLHVWLLVVIVFFSGTIVFGLAFFEPTIVAGLGYAGNRAQLMSVPPFVVAFVLSVALSIISDQYQCRGYITITCSILAMVGFTMYYASASNHIRYVSLFFSVPGAFGAVPALSAWAANNSAPHTRRATTVALVFMMSELGGILATWQLGFLSPAPDYTSATITFIAMSIGTVILSTANMVYLWRENCLKAERRRRMTSKEEEPEDLGDRSAWFVYSL